MDIVLFGLGGLLAGSFPGFLSSVGAVMEWGWDKVFGTVVIAWPALLAVLILGIIFR